MTEPTMNLDSACQQRIDRHLDAVEKALIAAGIDRNERRQITDNLQGQILEMLSARTGISLKPADLEAVLAELDPPEAYGRSETAKSAGREASPRPPNRFLGWLGFGLLSCAGILLTVAVAFSSSRALDVEALAKMAFGLTFLAVLVGLASVRSPQGKVALIGGGLLFVAMLFQLLRTSDGTSRPPDDAPPIQPAAEKPAGRNVD